MHVHVQVNELNGCYHRNVLPFAQENAAGGGEQEDGVVVVDLDAFIAGGGNMAAPNEKKNQVMRMWEYRVTLIFLGGG